MTGYSPLFRRLDALLTTNSEFWQFMPFSSNQLVWEQSHPEFCQWLLSLDDEAITHFIEHGEALAQAIAEWIPDAPPELYQLSQTDAYSLHQRSLPKGLDVGIPGAQMATNHRIQPGGSCLEIALARVVCW